MSGCFQYKPVIVVTFIAAVLAVHTGWAAQKIRAETIKADGVCFDRVYDDEHLVRHRNQIVRRVRAFIIPGRDPTGAQQPYALHLGVILRERQQEYQAVAGCGWKRVPRQSKRLLAKRLLECRVECDGGGVGLRFSQDAKSLLLYLKQPLGLGRIVLDRAAGGGCDGGNPDDFFELTERSDDKVFRLKAVPRSLCGGDGFYGE
jgi:hypothetical protein